MKIIKQHFKILTPGIQIDNILQQLESIGRVCYKSEKSITEHSAENFIDRIIANGHESVLEHMSISILFITDRGVGNELVRHRHCAFSQESTHYIDYNKKYGELTFIEPEGYYLGREKNDYRRGLSSEDKEKIYYTWQRIEDEYKCMKDIGQYWSRAVLPLGLKTELAMTTNIREWRHIMKIRTGEGCHPQMRSLMLSLVRWFKERLPLVAIDINPRGL